VVSGAFVALQSRINGEFGLALGNGALAALISFSTGLTLISLAMLASPSGRTGLAALRSAVSEGRLPWWSIIGGAAGAFLVFTQGLSVGLEHSLSLRVSLSHSMSHQRRCLRWGGSFCSPS
jgi:transporter family-2 protein